MEVEKKIKKDEVLDRILTNDFLNRDIGLNEKIEDYKKVDKKASTITNLSDLEVILKSDPCISRELLLQLQSKEFLLSNINNHKIISDIFVINLLYKDNKDKGFLKDTLLSKIFDLSNNDEIFTDNESILERLKIAILLYVSNPYIVENYFKIEKTHVNRKYITPKIKIALLSSSSIDNQEILMAFLGIEEVRENVKNNGIYHNILINDINKEDNKSYASLDALLKKQWKENDDIINLATCFDNIHLRNLYFYGRNDIIRKINIKEFKKIFFESVETNQIEVLVKSEYNKLISKEDGLLGAALKILMICSDPLIYSSTCSSMYSDHTKQTGDNSPQWYKTKIKEI